MPNLNVSSNIEAKAAAGFVGATELANMLVRKYDVAFRTAHKVAGALVKALIDSKQTLLDATPQLLQKVAKDSANLTLTVKLQDIVECTNPRKLVETYKVQGGPSPVEVERALNQRTKNHAQTGKAVSNLKLGLSNAEDALNSTVASYSLSNSPINKTLKNSKL